MKSDEKYFWIIISIVLGITLFNIDYTGGLHKENDRYSVEDNEEIDSLYYIDYSIFPEEGDIVDIVKATKYNPVESQCDSDPLITADNSKIDISKLEKHQLRWIAISRDLRGRYNYGDTVIIESNNKNIEGEWVVRDTMNPRFNNRIDLLAPFNDKYDMDDGPIEVILRKKY